MTDIQNPTGLSDGEEWCNCSGYAGVYEVSTSGRVRRVGRTRGAQVGRICVGSPTKQGYLSIRLQRNGQGRTFLVHRLVALSFLGEPPTDHEVNHRDGVKTNNALVNLEYVTRAQNMLHAYQSGLRPRTSLTSESSPNVKLTPDQVRTIRTLYVPRRYGTPRLAREFGVHQTTIHKIISGKSWSDLT